MRELSDWNYLIKAHMVKVCIVSDNQDFKADLVLQMTKYIEDFAQDSALPDVAVVDENRQQAEQVRRAHPSIPIILLTRENIEENDYRNQVLHKPFMLRQLLDMVAAANNKLDNSDEGFLTFNQYELQPTARVIIDLVSGVETKLTEKEVNILKYLYKAQNISVSKTDLQTNVWKYHEEVTTHTIETHIYRLRQKVEKNSGRRLILTDNGRYKLNME